MARKPKSKRLVFLPEEREGREVKALERAGVKMVEIKVPDREGNERVSLCEAIEDDALSRGR